MKSLHQLTVNCLGKIIFVAIKNTYFRCFNTIYIDITISTSYEHFGLFERYEYDLHGDVSIATEWPLNVHPMLGRPSETRQWHLECNPKDHSDLVAIYDKQGVLGIYFLTGMPKNYFLCS